jgi:hypothetical protein
MSFRSAFNSAFSPAFRSSYDADVGVGVIYVPVLDYSTSVGPLTIVDQSGFGNTATLYSGRGLTMDGVGDLIDFGSPTFSEPVASMTGYARSTETSINLGLTAATLTGNDTWETFSADTPAKDYGDSLWFNGVDNYIAADPTNFNPSAAGQVVNLKWIPNVGATSAQVIWGYRDEGTELVQVTQQNPTTVILQVRGSNNIVKTDTITVQDGQYISGTLTYDGVAKTAAFTSNAGTASVSGFGTISASTKLTIGATFISSLGAFVNGTIIQSSTNGVDDLTDGTPSGTFVTVTQYFTNPDFILGTGYNGDISDVRCLGATGTVLGHWSLADFSNPSGNTSNGMPIVDSGANQFHGTCTGCSGFTGEATIPQTADKNWNRYENLIRYSTNPKNTATWTVNSAYNNAGDVSVTLPNGSTGNAFHFKKSTGAGRRIDTTLGLGTTHVFLYLRGGDYGTTRDTFSVRNSTGISKLSGVGSTSFTSTGGVSTITGLSATSWTLIRVAYTSTSFQMYPSFGSETASCYIYQLEGKTSPIYSELYYATGAYYINGWLVSASDANDQIDALGTAISEPRLNTQVVNLFGEGELATTPAAASLDTIKTVSSWIWHDGTAHTVLDFGTPTVGTTTTALTSSGFTGVTYFVNGTIGTTLSAGWNYCVVASTAALATDDIDILTKSGSQIDYNVTIPAGRVQTYFNNQKSLYGL